MNKYIKTVLVSFVIVQALIGCSNEDSSLSKGETPIPMQTNVINDKVRFQITVDNISNISIFLGDKERLEKSLSAKEDIITFCNYINNAVSFSGVTTADLFRTVTIKMKNEETVELLFTGKGTVFKNSINGGNYLVNENKSLSFTEYIEKNE
ncbi:hypothetical protein [Paenibacillus marinisediminis]